MTGKASLSNLPTLSDLRAILKTALPLGIGYIGTMLIGVTDTIMLGHLSPNALSAAGLALSVSNIILVIGWGMVFPILVFVSRRCGRECPRSRIPWKIIRQNLWVCGILFVPSCVVLWNTTPILLLTGQNPLLARMAGEYMDYYLWAVFPAVARYGFALALIAMHRTGIIAFITWLEVVLNIILDYGLIFGKFGFPTMGMAGAGLASIIVYAFGHTVFFFCIFDFRRFLRSITVRRVWRPSRNILGQFFRLGWPKSLEWLITHAIFSVFALLAGWIGILAVAAHTIALQTIVMVSYTLSLAVAEIVTVRVAAASAQGNHPRIWRALNGGVVVLLLLLSPLVALFWLFPEWVVVLFIGSEVRETHTLLPLASPLIVLIGLFVITDGLRIVGSQALNGLTDMKMPALVAGLTYWGIALPLGAWLGFSMELGVRGFWIGLIVGTAMSAMGYLNRFQRLVWNFGAISSSR